MTHRPAGARRLAVGTALAAMLSCSGCFTAMLWNPREFGRGEPAARTKAVAIADVGVTVPLTAGMRDALGETLPPLVASSTAAALRFEPRTGAPTSVLALLASAPRSSTPVLYLYVASDRTMTGLLQVGPASVPGRVDALARLPAPASVDAPEANAMEGAAPPRPERERELELVVEARRRFRPSSATTRALVTPLTAALDVVTLPVQLLVVMFRGL